MTEKSIYVYVHQIIDGSVCFRNLPPNWAFDSVNVYWGDEGDVKHYTFKGPVDTFNDAKKFFNDICQDFLDKKCIAEYSIR